MTADQVLEVLQDAGLQVALAPEQVLRVKPSSHLTADLRELIRSSKVILIDWLTTANDGIHRVTAPSASALVSKELAVVYYNHHFHCQTCIAAGRGIQYGGRCAVGLALWTPYARAVDSHTEEDNHGRR